MTDELRTFTVGDIEVTDFRDGMIFLKDGEDGLIIISIEDLEKIYKQLKGE